eukprot:CAMPEP_0182419022 /NCGR_PEP_ID=MMETSP1167-20130531/3411_1 /TAXON_ID=2988 /ORGANISM="Mallomonas Sp, Strain CCMP3275" /LENGTH=120 /DNA_ID=CAMNT_0024593583 /DNA_START=50 /DNA_END=412 /DNA_ORIENTATION=+
MAQGKFKLKATQKKANSAKSKKANAKLKVAAIGNPLHLPKNKYQLEALNDRDLTKAICKSSEQKVAGKLIQGGGLLKVADIRKAGKELNREQKRSLVKRKLTRIEETLKQLKAEEEKFDT